MTIHRSRFFAFKGCILTLMFCLGITGCASAPLITSGDFRAQRSRTRLVLTLVIDQLRADYLTRYQDRFLSAVDDSGRPGGFAYLMEAGAYYPLAEYEVAHALTAPGHATLLTGAYPYRTGIVLNRWFDSEAQRLVYCVGDASYEGVGTVSPTTVRGTAPTNLKAETLSDALKSVAIPAKVASIGLKDRAAILMGGFRSDLALWFDWGGFQWMSSTYYRPDGTLPNWADALNAGLTARRGEEVVFPAGAELSSPESEQRIQRRRIGEPGVVTDTGYGVEITADAAIAAFEHMALGQGAGTDFLNVSFSTFDYLGHAVGPASPAMADMLVAHDREISRLLNAVRNGLGGSLEGVLIALTGDHGAPPSPEALIGGGHPAGRIDEVALQGELNQWLKGEYGDLGSGAEYIPFMSKLNVYLNHEAIMEKGVSAYLVREGLARKLSSRDDVFHVTTVDRLRHGVGFPGMYGRQLDNSYFPGRSGDVIALLAPYHITGSDPVIHMSGYSYDRFVPLIIVGDAVRQGVYAHAAEIIDLAPTLSWLLGVIPPASSEGRVLHEILTP